MMQQLLPRRPVENWEAEQKSWIAELEHLIDQAELWSKELGWVTKRDSKQVTEDSIGTYETPVLWIQTPYGRLLLDPIARYVMAADGRVDLCALPSYEPATIVRIDGKWSFWSSNRGRIERAWTKESMNRVVEQLLSNE